MNNVDASSQQDKNIRALHVHDAAGVGHDLVTTANEMGLRWQTLPMPSSYKWRWPGPLNHVLIRGRRTLWDANIAMRGRFVDVVHIHTGGLAPHARWVKSPWVLHLHGTDIRTRQYEESWHNKIQYGLQRAARIVYSTPDLAEHVASVNHKATYLPLTVRVEELPDWKPFSGRVVFASRWDDVKGAQTQIELARLLRADYPHLELHGLDWGKRAVEAAAAGVTLSPRMGKEEYTHWIASSSVVVGQMSTILSVSELQALAIGVPVVSSFDQSFYPGLRKLNERDAPGAVAPLINQIVSDPVRAAELQSGRQFIIENHSSRRGVETLLRVYRTLV
ncbi:hypothetical protein GCM10027404_04450 [Arthrobacter tumbae]|uniref:glycosyltransferase family 4 protein n=1 Tax=Arthrobacter tumbae TaxID=163874 RepID=UPI00195CC4F0|nr:glycosyltransferase family 4 protein [Arthrobacter tumbae]MBM7780113.1 glycosyltransferase involved in cell wall biosynthesis [Arthrobacter tumbae]